MLDCFNGSPHLPAPKPILLIAQQELVRNSLEFWLERCCGLQSHAVAEVGNALGLTGMALIHVADPSDSDTWFEHQIEWLHTNSPGLPIAMLAKTGSATKALIRRFDLRFHIPTGVSATVARGALDLILAGGTHAVLN